jgi:hypothetical protein
LPAKDLRQVPAARTRPLPNAAETDPDLARVVEAWPALPQAIRRAMLALVGSAPATGRDADRPR